MRQGTILARADGCHRSDKGQERGQVHFPTGSRGRHPRDVATWDAAAETCSRRPSGNGQTTTTRPTRHSATYCAAGQQSASLLSRRCRSTTLPNHAGRGIARHGLQTARLCVDGQSRSPVDHAARNRRDRPPDAKTGAQLRRAIQRTPPTHRHTVGRPLQSQFGRQRKLCAALSSLHRPQSGSRSHDVRPATGGRVAPLTVATTRTPYSRPIQPTPPSPPHPKRAQRPTANFYAKPCPTMT